MRMLLGAVRVIASSRPQATLADGKCTRYFASGCTICVDACPAEAIDITELSIDIGDSCHGCGICAAACPVDAIVGVGFSADTLSATLAEEGGLQCDLAQKIDRTGTQASIPCLAAIDPETIAAEVMTRDVVLKSGPCEQCPIGSPQTVDATIGRARKIVEMSGGTGSIELRHVELVEGSAPRRRPSSGLSRRGMFDADTYSSSGKSARRRLLEAAALPALPQVRAEDGCTGCEACTSVCPADALELRDRNLVFKPAECVACGECVRVCPEDVLGLDEVGDGRFPVVIATAPAARCERCDTTLGPGETGRCHRCKTRTDLTSDIWRQLGIDA